MDLKKTCGVFMTLKEVMESARVLTAREKAFMAHCLISSKISGISWEEMKKQIRP
jgi:hypothetical protein